MTRLARVHASTHYGDGIDPIPGIPPFSPFAPVAVNLDQVEDSVLQFVEQAVVLTGGLRPGIQIELVSSAIIFSSVGVGTDYDSPAIRMTGNSLIWRSLFQGSPLTPPVNTFVEMSGANNRIVDSNFEVNFDPTASMVEVLAGSTGNWIVDSVFGRDDEGGIFRILGELAIHGSKLHSPVTPLQVLGTAGLIQVSRSRFGEGPNLPDHMGDIDAFAVYESILGLGNITPSNQVAGAVFDPAGILPGKPGLVESGTPGGWDRDGVRTVAAADAFQEGEDAIFADTTGGAFAVELPPAALARRCTVHDGAGQAGANNITVTTPGAETINGAPSAVISVNFGSLTLMSDGTNWYSA